MYDEDGDDLGGSAVGTDLKFVSNYYVVWIPTVDNGGTASKKCNPQKKLC